MEYHIVMHKDDSLKIYKNKHDQSKLPEGSRQFVCSSNVTVQDLFLWIADGYKNLNTIKEVKK